MKKYLDLEEIKKDYPINQLVNKKVEEKEDILFYYSQHDLESYKKDYSSIEILGNCTCKGRKEVTHGILITGYYYDGSYYYPCYNTWDGIQIYNEN